MSEFRAEKPENRVKMAEMSKSDIPAKELTQPNTAKVSSSFGSNFKARLASLKVKATAPVPVRPSVPVVDVEESRPKDAIELGIKAIEQDELEKQTQVILNNDSSYYEQMSENLDSRERFKSVFMSSINENIGLNLDELRDKIKAMHEMLFDQRTGIQALMALRQDKLKDASADEREKRMKEDFAIKMPKKSGNGEVKVRAKSGVKTKSEQKEDPYVQMKRTMVDKLILKGKTKEEANAIADKKIAALKGDD